MTILLLSLTSDKVWPIIRRLAGLPAQAIQARRRREASRRAVADLVELDDRLLTDIGLFRTDIANIADRLSRCPEQA